MTGKPKSDNWGLNPEMLSAAEAASAYYSSLSDWNEILEGAIEDFERGLITREELIQIVRGRLVRG